MRGSAARRLVVAVVFGLMLASAALALLSDTSRRDGEIDRPALLVAGAATFAVAALIALVARRLRPEWQATEGLTWGGGAVVLALLAAVVVAASVAVRLL